MKNIILEIKKHNVNNPKKAFYEENKIYNPFFGYENEIEFLGNKTYIMKVYKSELFIPENKYDVFERYNFLSNNPSEKTNYERNLLMDIIVNNSWSNEYFELYPSKYGL